MAVGTLEQDRAIAACSYCAQQSWNKPPEDIRPLPPSNPGLRLWSSALPLTGLSTLEMNHIPLLSGIYISVLNVCLRRFLFF